jgi:hypothetical protein
MTRAYIALLIFALVLVSPFIVSAASGDIGNTPVKPDFETNGGIDPDVDECVKDVDFMRSDHMVLLKDERVKAVRHGERQDKFEIEKCFSCHDFDKFCKECHDYNGVKPTCFNETGGCHTNEKLDASERPEI